MSLFFQQVESCNHLLLVSLGFQMDLSIVIAAYLNQFIIIIIIIIIHIIIIIIIIITEIFRVA